jgi:hypothetical protein
MSDTAVVVFTVEGVDTILHQGGTQYWVLNRERARESEFVVLVQNRSKSDSERDDWEFATASEPHGTAFLVGRISDIVPKDNNRWLIKISEFARINIPDVWKGWRFPVRYLQLSVLGIDPNALQFTPLSGVNGKQNGAPRPLSIPEAKRGLALGLGVKEDAIEIVIRA